MKKFKVEHDSTLWSCEIAINVDDESVIKDLHEMVNFWTGSDQRLNSNDGDIVKTFVQQLGMEIFYIIASDNVNLVGVKREFESREGWCKMDGSYGIEILSVDDLSFDHYEFQVEEVQP